MKRLCHKSFTAVFTLSYEHVGERVLGAPAQNPGSYALNDGSCDRAIRDFSIGYFADPCLCGVLPIRLYP